jgi:hypothetical protein
MKNNARGQEDGEYEQEDENLKKKISEDPFTDNINSLLSSTKNMNA